MDEVRPMRDEQLRIAVIGSGVAGLTATWLLQRRHEVVLFEKNEKPGGHTNTIVVPEGPDAGTPIDTGFIVCNDKNYPLLHKLLDQLGVAWRWSDMSFGFCCRETGLMYAGTDFNGLFAQRGNLFSPSFWSLLLDIRRFCTAARTDLHAGRLGTETLEQFLQRHGISDAAVRNYIVPMGAAIWSATHRDMLAFPAQTLIRFWENHGLLSLEDRPRWQTITGGSHSYIKAMLPKFARVKIHLDARIASVQRGTEAVTIRHADGREDRFDHVVLATHADEALKLLADPTPEESRLLGPWRYQLNRTVLHSDARVMPPLRRAWASWNYVRPARLDPDRPVPVTYHMNRLQGLQTKHDYFVTLNAPDEIEPAKIVKVIDYLHPVFSAESDATRAGLSALVRAGRTSFCGSYFGNGFHEDAVRAGEAVAKSFGESL